ncbi:hypothetical protein Q670_10900 [Alcanivorax sp. P2S70]|nr:hypothetical protein Q670_10900 [Alcanivorax sp. P2S70]
MLESRSGILGQKVPGLQARAQLAGTALALPWCYG